MHFVPFSRWIIPKDIASPSSSKGDSSPENRKPAETRKDKVGSWIISYDDNGVPYWTNSVSKESTYRLLIQQANQPGMPLKHVGDGGIPPWSLPLKAPSSSSKSKLSKPDGSSGGGSDNKTRKNSKITKENKENAGRGGGGDDGSSGGRMGLWEELFDAVTGTKVWYNSETRKTTTKDPFW